MQENRVVRLIRRQLVKRSLDMLQEIADREDKKVGSALKKADWGYADKIPLGAGARCAGCCCVLQPADPLANASGLRARSGSCREI